MGWIRRGKNRHYYRLIRRRGRWTYLYLGNGELARLAAAVDQAQRHYMNLLDQHVAALQTLVNSLQEPLTTLSVLGQLLTAAAMLAAGYHRYARHFWQPRRQRRA